MNGDISLLNIFFSVSFRCSVFLCLVADSPVFLLYALSLSCFPLLAHSFFSRGMSLLWIDISIPCHLIVFVLRRKSNLFSIKKSRPKIILYRCFPFGFTCKEVLSSFLLLVNCGKRKPVMFVVSPVLKFPGLVSQMLVLSLHWKHYFSTNFLLTNPPVLPVSRSPM